MMMKISLLALFAVLAFSAKGTQLSDLPKQFLGLISDEIKEFYEGLSPEEHRIISIVDASSDSKANYTAAYRKFSETLGDKAEEYLNKEAAKILKLDMGARNLYLQILQLPNRLKLIAGGSNEDWKRMAKELLVQFEKLSNRSKLSLKKHYAEIWSTLTGDEFRKFADFISEEPTKETSS